MIKQRQLAPAHTHHKVHGLFRLVLHTMVDNILDLLLQLVLVDVLLDAHVCFVRESTATHPGGRAICSLVEAIQENGYHLSMLITNSYQRCN